MKLKLIIIALLLPLIGLAQTFPDSTRQTSGVSFTPQFNYKGANASTSTIQLYNPLNGKYFGIYSAYQADRKFAPLVGTGYLQVNNNLSDVNSKSQSWYNIGGSKSPYKMLQDFTAPENAPSYIASGLYNNNPVLVQAFSGKYLLWYRQGPAHTSGGQINIRTSPNGVTWSAETAVVPSTTGLEHFSTGGGVTPTGRIILSYTERVVSTGVVSAYVIYSDDEGTTWSSRVLLSSDADAYGKMIVADGGLLVLPIYSETAPLSKIVTSSDNGVTWSSPITVTTSPTPGYGNETSIAYLGSGNIVAVVRDSGDHEFSQFLSTDNGSTWTFQGYTTIDGSDTKVSPELSVYLSPSGRRMVSLYYANRSYNKIKVITASALDIINNGINAWQTSTLTALTGDLGTPGFGYPTVVHPNNSEYSIGAYHLDVNPVTPVAEIYFFTYPPSNAQPIVLGNSLFQSASFSAAHTITDPLAITYKQYNDSTLVQNTTTAQSASFNITGTGQIGTGNTGVKIRSYTGGSNFALYNASLTPSTTNHSLVSNGAITEINGSTNSYLSVVGSPIVNASSTGASVTGTLSSTSTFQTGSGASGVLFRPTVGASTFGSWYSTNITPSGLNYTIASNGVDSYFNGTNSAVLNINNSPIITATSTGASVIGTLSATGTLSGSIGAGTANNFVVTNSGLLQYRTAAQVLGDIGAAATNQTMFIGTTSVAINRASGTLNLAGIGSLGIGGALSGVTTLSASSTITSTMGNNSLLFNASSAGTGYKYMNVSQSGGGAMQFGLAANDGTFAGGTKPNQAVFGNANNYGTAFMTNNTVRDSISKAGYNYILVTPNTVSGTANLMQRDATTGEVQISTALPIGTTATNWYTTSATPSISVGAAAGTSATIGISGNNQDGVISLVVGSSPPSSGDLFTVTMSGGFAYPISCAPVITANGATTIGIQSSVGIGGTTTTTWTVRTQSALSASTNYQWYYHNGGY